MDKQRDGPQEQKALLVYEQQEVKNFDGDEKPQSSTIGVLAVIGMNFLISVSRLGIKYLYNTHSDFGVVQLLIYRATIAFAFNILYLNVRLKEEMYGSVRRELIGQLVAKVLHSQVGQFLLYSSVMYWPITTCAAVRLSSPLFTLILSCIFLREFATRTQYAYLALTILGAAVIIGNTPEGDSDVARIAALGSATFLAYLCLFGEPFSMACGQVLTRKLRKLSNMTVSCYTNLSQICIYLPIAMIIGTDLLIFEAFSALDWVAIISVSIIHVFAQILFFIAYANLPTPAVQPLNFIGIIFQFFIDMIFFGMSPNAWQVSGLLLVSIVSGVQTFQVIRADKKVTQEEDATAQINEKNGDDFTKQS